MSLKCLLLALLIALSMSFRFENQCPNNTSNCMGLNGNKCCKYNNAVCCPDMNTCCPKGYTCSNGGCARQDSNELLPSSELNGWSLRDLKKVNWDAVLRCIGDAASLGPDIIKLVKAIKEKKYLECAEIAFNLLGKGSSVIQKCIGYFKNYEVNEVSNKMKYRFDWDALVKCIMSTAPIVQDVIALVDAIKQKNYVKAIELIYSLIKNGSEAVKECLKVVILNQNSFGFDWEALVKCLMSAAPLVPDVIELINAIKAKDYVKAIQLAYKLIEKGSVVIKECMKVIMIKGNKLKLRFDWDAFVKCLMSTAPLVPEIMELIEAIKKGDFIRAIQLAYKLIEDGSVVVKECMKVIKPKNFRRMFKLKFDWEAFLKCLMSAAPLVPEIAELIDAIKRGDYVKAIQLVYKLIADGSVVVKECMKVKKNKLQLRFDWDAFLKCLMSTAPLVPEIMELIEAIKKGDFVRAIQLVYKLIADGSVVVKECMKVIKPKNFRRMFKLKFDWEAFLKCLMSAAPLVPEIAELIDAIKRGDYVKAIQLVYKLIADGSVVVKECMKVKTSKLRLRFDWEAFLKCIQSAVPLVPEIIELINAIKAKDYVKAIQLAYKLIEKGSVVVKECMKVIKPKNFRHLFSLKFDWEAFVKCLMSTAPMVQEIIELIDAIERGDYVKAIEMIYKLIASGSEVVKECMKVTHKKRKANRMRIYFNIDWESVLQCLKAAKPIAKDILELIHLIKNQKYPEAFEKAHKIIKDGSALVKKCLNKSTTNDVAVNIDWKLLLKCLVEHLPELAKDIPVIKDLIDAIKTKNWPKALGLLYKLYQDGRDILKVCLPPQNFVIPKFKIDWDLLADCIKEAGPIVKDIKALVKAIEAKQFEEALALLSKILKSGNQLVKKCVKIAQKKK